VTLSTNNPERRWFRLVRRRQIWLPTWRGWLLVLALCVLASYAGLRGIHPFLALDRPVASDILVVEGWVPNYALKRGLDLSVEQKSSYLILTGGTVRGEVNPEPGDTYARMAMKRLQRIGGDLPHVHPVPSPELTPEPVRDRTYASAIAVKKWLKDQGVGVRSINVLTMGTHARRSRLLFQKAFGPKVNVGVIAIRDGEYDPRVWWRYSEGVKEVLSEGAAYLYARFLFRPG
jgi:uncharacterized SAM-binding protein YcdF (DUF218 family)